MLLLTGERVEFFFWLSSRWKLLRDIVDGQEDEKKNKTKEEGKAFFLFPSFSLPRARKRPRRWMILLTSSSPG